MKYNKENAWLLKNTTKSLNASAMSTSLYYFFLCLSSSIPVLFFCLRAHLFLKWSPEGNSSSALDLLSTLCYTRGVSAAAENGTTHCQAPRQGLLPYLKKFIPDLSQNSADEHREHRAYWVLSRTKDLFCSCSVIVQIRNNASSISDAAVTQCVWM